MLTNVSFGKDSEYLPDRKALDKVSGMEIDRVAAQHLLAEAERAASAPYVDYPPTPKWYPPAAGLWAAGFTLTVTAAWRRPVIFVPAIVALLALEALFLVWYRRYRRTMPDLRAAPVEFRSEFRRYAVGLVGVVAAVVVAAWLTGPWAAAATTFVLVTVGVLLYERRYAAAATATHARLERR